MLETVDIRKIITADRYAEASLYIGTDGFFGNTLEQLDRAIRDKHIGILKGFCKSNPNFIFQTMGKRNYSLFLPIRDRFLAEEK